ncbi:MAG: hypothetical protein ACKON8_03435 [Planctomycetota bacterium]
MRSTPLRRTACFAVPIAAMLALGAASAPPACLRCGASCDLEPICVYIPSTKKVPKNTYDVDCEPICLPGCGSSPWGLARQPPASCCDCGETPCDCPGRVRTRKRLRTEIVEEETRVVERKVEYLCRSCSDRGSPSCCRGRRSSAPTWYARLTAWWPSREAGDPRLSDEP